MENWVVRFLSSIAEIDRTTWNVISGTAHPFTRYEFLAALEYSGATTAGTGWQVSHAVISHGAVPVAVLPLYLKSHSYGEYVFDFAWADAWSRYGLSYYPKLVASIPFTPVTGPRLCIAANVDRAAVLSALLPALDARVAAMGASGWHVLFPRASLAERLAEHGTMTRRAVQFHWFNRDYACFDDFLARFTSRKRKNLRKERSKIAAQGITLRTCCGEAITEDLWDQFFTFYQLTYARRSGHGGYLNREFFRQIAATMGEHLVLVLASRAGRIIAGALSFRDSDTLYGRYWGCIEDCDFLHFEACYHQGIEYCIEQGLQHFDSGAQGEHKIQRGFEPVYTYSTHVIAEPSFRPAIAEFLREEGAHVDGHKTRASELLPYRE